MSVGYRMTDERRRGVLARACVLDANAQHLGRLAGLLEAQDTRAVLLTGHLHLLCESLGSAATDEDAIAVAESSWREKCAELVLDPDGGDLCGLLRTMAGTPVMRRSPFDRLREVFVDFTRDACGFSESWSMTVSLTLESLIAHPRPGSDDPYAVSASTTGSDVVLRLKPDRLGPHAWAIVPRILVHEFVCHVIAGDTDEHPDNHSQFAEGFMDWAAEYFLHAWAHEALGPLAPAALDHASRAQVALSPMTTSSGFARNMGRDAARQLVWARCSEGRDIAGASADIARLAVAINLKGIPRFRKDAVVGRVHAGQPPFRNATLTEAITALPDLDGVLI